MLALWLFLRHLFNLVLLRGMSGLVTLAAGGIAVSPSCCCPDRASTPMSSWAASFAPTYMLQLLYLRPAMMSYQAAIHPGGKFFLELIPAASRAECVSAQTHALISPACSHISGVGRPIQKRFTSTACMKMAEVLNRGHIGVGYMV